MFKNLKIRGKLLLSVISLSALSVALILVIVYSQVSDTVVRFAKSEANSIAREYASIMDAELELAIDAARALAYAFTSYRDIPQEIRRMIFNEMLQHVLELNQGFLGVYTCWEPNVLDGLDNKYANTAGHDQTGRFIPYWNRGSGKVILEPLVDYDKEGAGDYYLLPKKHKEETLINPYRYVVAGKEMLITSLIVPIIIDGRFVGMVGVDIDLDYLQDMVVSVKPYSTGYALLLSHDGQRVAHPKKELVGKVFWEQEYYNNNLKEKQEIIDAVQNGKFYSVNKVALATGENSYQAYAPIYVGSSKTPWSFGVVIPMEQVMSSSNQILLIAIGIGVVALVIIAIFVFILAQGFSKPIIEAVKQADIIAEGDLSSKVSNKTIDRRDEIGMLSNSFNNMQKSLFNKAESLEKIANGDLTVAVHKISEKDMLGVSLEKVLSSLNNLLGQVSVAVDQVVNGSNQVSQSAQSVSQGAAEQASSLEEITSSLMEITAQTKRNAENATQGSALANKANEDSAAGNEQMKRLVSAMQAINSSADEIRKIVKIIDDIAFQTNLLALNANVEAARAGKYGKGFAVVAEEVRNLAVRSANAVKETTVKIDEAIRNIKKGNELVELTAAQLDEIAKSAVKVTDLASEIAVASKEQSTGLEQISKGLSQIDEVTQANTASSEEAASASEELSGQANHLMAMLKNFRLREQVKETVVVSGVKPQPHQQALALSHHEEVSQTKKEVINPKHVIELDDDNFGKF